MTYGEIVELIERVRADGGATIDTDGNVPTAGWCVGDPAYSQTVNLSDDALADVIMTYLERVPSGRYFGLWVDPLGTLWLDTIDIIDNAADALSLGRLRGEFAIYNLSDGQTLECA